MSDLITSEPVQERVLFYVVQFPLLATLQSRGRTHVLNTFSQVNILIADIATIFDDQGRMRGPKPKFVEHGLTPPPVWRHQRKRSNLQDTITDVSIADFDQLTRELSLDL